MFPLTLGAQPDQMCAHVFVRDSIRRARRRSVPYSWCGQLYHRPARSRYWIIAKDNNGARRPMERFDTEDKAVRRLRELRERTIIDRTNIFLKPKRPR